MDKTTNLFQINGNLDDFGPVLSILIILFATLFGKTFSLC